jgi:hypothetical protein
MKMATNPFASEHEIRTIIEQMIVDAVQEQRDLLSKGRVEDTFAAEFAFKLRQYFQGGDICVDIGYRKHGNATKYLNDRRIALDIAIHQIGTDVNNLVAIEVETCNKPARDDIWKLIELTQPLGGYGYKLGLYFAVGVEGRAGEILSLEWYKEGHID